MGSSESFVSKVNKSQDLEEVKKEMDSIAEEKLVQLRLMLKKLNSYVNSFTMIAENDATATISDKAVRVNEKTLMDMSEPMLINTFGQHAFQAQMAIREYGKSVRDIGRRDLTITVTKVEDLKVYAFAIVIDSEGIKTNMTQSDMAIILQRSKDHLLNLDSVKLLDKNSKPTKFEVKGVLNPQYIILILDVGDDAEEATLKLVTKMHELNALEELLDLSSMRQHVDVLGAALGTGSAVGALTPLVPVSAAFNVANFAKKLIEGIILTSKNDNFMLLIQEVISHPASIQWSTATSKGGKEVYADVTYGAIIQRRQSKAQSIQVEKGNGTYRASVST